jgi:WD40 repeat protein
VAAAAVLGCQAGGDGNTQNPGPPIVYYMALAYAPAHGRITVAGDGGLIMFDPQTGRKLKTVDPGIGLAVIVREAGDVMAGVQLGNLWIFDSDGKLQRNIKHDDQVYSLALSPDGSVVYSGGVDGKVRRFDTATGAEIKPALGPESQDFVNDLSVSADGLYVAAAEKEGVRVWRTTDGAPVVQLPRYGYRVRFAPGGGEVTVVDDLGAATYAGPSGAEIRRYDIDGIMVRVAYSSDGTKLAVTSANDTVIKVFDASTGAALVALSDESAPRPPEQPGVRDVAELSFVEGDTRVAVGWRSGRLAEWNVADGTLLWSRLDSDTP